jgi:hypothetical protein
MGVLRHLWSLDDLYPALPLCVHRFLVPLFMELELGGLYHLHLLGARNHLHRPHHAPDGGWSSLPRHGRDLSDGDTLTRLDPTTTGVVF